VDLQNDVCKYKMRFYEIQSIRPKKPLTPAQARINALKQNVENTRKQLQAERERQRRQREAERTRKQLQQRYAQAY
jgi:capsule polysaccharide export protein KpsE/RkpR